MADDFEPGTVLARATVPSQEVTFAPGTVLHRAPETRAPKADEPKGFLSNAPDDTWLSSTRKAVGTVAGKVAAMVPGLPGDIASALDYAETGARSLLPGGKPHAQLLKERQEDLKKKEAEGMPMFPTSDEVYKWMARKTGAGEYKPTSTPGKYLMTGAETGLGMLTPMGVTGSAVKAATQAAHAGKGAASAVRAGTAAAAPAVGLGAAVGAGSQGVLDATDSPGAAMATGLVPLLHPAGKAAWNTLRTDPVTGAREQFIGKMATPRETSAAIRAGGADTAPSGAPRTTAQAYEDSGLAQLQTTMLDSQKATEGTRNRMASIAEQQREANVGALDRAAPANANVFEATQTAERTQQQLRDEVERLNAAIPRATSAGEAADLKRQLVDARRRAHDAETTRLYESVDPHGTAEASITGTKSLAERMLQGHDELADGPMNAALRGQIDRILNPDMPEVLAYSRAVKLDKSIERLRREAAQAGDTDLARQFGQLKTAVMGDLESVRLNYPGGPGMQDPAATLRAAKDHYIQGTHLFENPYLGNAIDRGPYKQFTVVPEDVASKIFVKGDKGASTVNAWLGASGHDPAAVGHMRDIALARLHQLTLRGGEPRPLTQSMLNSWKDQYGSALTALDHASPGFSRQFDNVASVSTQLENFSRSAAANFLGMRDAREVQGAINNILTARDGPTQLHTLLTQIPSGQRSLVMDGLRRAGADHIIEQFVRPTNGAIQGAAFAKYVRNNQSSLRALFGQSYGNIRAVADELARYERVTNAGRSYTGSPTGFNTRAEIQPHATHNPNFLETLMTASLVNPIAGHAASSAVGTYSIGKRMLNALESGRNQKIDAILADVMLDPKQARALLQKTYKLDGEPNYAALKLLMRGEQPGLTAQEQREDRRRERGYASGGTVTIDHDGEADRLINLAEKARRGLGTEPLLEQPDERIVRALAIANSATRGG